MKERYVVLTACICVAAIGLGLVIMLQANRPSVGKSAPTSIARLASTPTELATVPVQQNTALRVSTVTPPSTATMPQPSDTPIPILPTQVASWPSYQGRYFTVRVPRDWKFTGDDAGDLPGGSPADTVMMTTQVERAEWSFGSAQPVYANIAALYVPYAEQAKVLGPGGTPFQAGSLNGQIWTNRHTGDYTSAEILLSGTGDNSGPICYEASLQMAGLSQQQQDALVRQFEDALSTLVPSQEALQSTPTAVIAPAGVGACAAASLSVDVGQPQGCVGWMCGTIVLTNTGKAACWLRGRPTMEYRTPEGKNLPIEQHSLPSAYGNLDSEVVVHPGDRARLFYMGAHSCPVPGWTPAIWSMLLPGTGERVELYTEPRPIACSSGPMAAEFQVGTFRPMK